MTCSFAHMALAAALLGLGCQGAIGGSESEGSGGDAAPGLPAAEPLHRLNRLEYNNTVRDLLGTSLTPADDFPPDSSEGGFDNMAEGLSLAPSLMDLYAAAARELARTSLEDAPRYARRIGARQHAIATGQEGAAFDWGWSLPRHGSRALVFALEVPEDESVTVSVLAGGSASAGVAAPELGIEVDGVELQRFTVTAPPTAPAVFAAKTPLAKGEHTISVTFPNGYDQPAENVFNTLVVGYLDVTSEAMVTPQGRALVYVCDPSLEADPEDCYRTIVTRFAERAFRRPLTDEEAEDVFELWKSLGATEGGDAAVGLVVRAVLMSSKFLYRASLPAAAPGRDADGSEGLVPLDDHVLASRLSYFLWSSMPDGALLEAAASGALRTDDGLRAQARRMLADPKSSALRKGFAAQWLGTRALARSAPDPSVFPYFDEPLRAAMIEEAELFFDDFLRSGRPIGEMLVPDFGFLNDRLAQHYRLPAPGTDEVVRVELSEGDRRGLVAQGAWLTATSASTRTSPVNRGRWILEQLLCIPIPPPPPDIPAFMEPKEGGTVRETLAEHRENPVCASCHDRLDPAGLGMEEFDGIGARRATENGRPVDTSGAIPPGEPFAGGAELAKLLEDDRRFPECVAEKLYAYAMGRPVAAEDAVFLTRIVDDLPIEGDGLDKLIELIVLSPAFRMREPEGAE